jgi:transaldolase
MGPIEELRKAGQSVWLDQITRSLITSGKLAELVAGGVSGLTSNPTIFQKAIDQDDHYDGALRNLVSVDPNDDAKAYFERLAIEDIQRAADILRPVYDRTDAADGYACLEVSPHAAYDPLATIEEARHLWQRVDRPNVMIKVPATPQGIDAIEGLIAEGINVNATLMFSTKQCEAVAESYIRGVKRAAHPHEVASVASVFVSRIDTYVDRALERIGTPEALELRGRAAVAHSKLAYHRFRQAFHMKSFVRQLERGARPQRLLWASTSTKNPAYSDVKYVEELVAPDTVNTMPLETLEAFRNHGMVRSTLMEGTEEAARVMTSLANVGVDFDAITDQLLQDGVKAFADSFDAVVSTLDRKRKQMATA